jgi:hypothetical protein
VGPPEAKEAGQRDVSAGLTAVEARRG